MDKYESRDDIQGISPDEITVFFEDMPEVITNNGKKKALVFTTCVAFPGDTTKDVIATILETYTDDDAESYRMANNYSLYFYISGKINHKGKEIKKYNYFLPNIGNCRLFIICPSKK
jgi:hypothetical protein